MCYKWRAEIPAPSILATWDHLLDLGSRCLRMAVLKEGQASPRHNSTRPLLQVTGLRCRHARSGPWPWRSRWLRAVDGIDLNLEAGEAIGIVGASGCGKSSLCHGLAGCCPYGAAKWSEGQAVLQRRGGQRHRQLRRSLQMVFEDSLACLKPAMTGGAGLVNPGFG